jgi:hypothetical protein
MGLLSAIDVTIRFVNLSFFFLPGLSHQSLTLHKRSCMARLGAGMPSWEKQVAEMYRGRFATSMRIECALYGAMYAVLLIA